MSGDRRFLNSRPVPNGSARLDRGGASLAALMRRCRVTSSLRWWLSRTVVEGEDAWVRVKIRVCVYL